MRRAEHYRFLAMFAAVLLLAVVSTWCYMRCQRKASSPPWFAAAGLPSTAYNVLLMGVDLPYDRDGRAQHPEIQSFNGRSDTIVLIHVDPQNGTISGLHIPRDTVVDIPRYGLQKINAANAIGGPELAMATIGELTNVPIDHYMVMNLHGLVEAVNELGGVTVDVPKPMSYMDWTAKLKIDLQPGLHTLTGNQAMGFVRFRHDALGDIGRIQRQELFMRAFAARMSDPRSWAHLPALIAIAKDNVLTDMSDIQLLQAFNFSRSLKRSQFRFAMLPGHFGSAGRWIPDPVASQNVVARICGLPYAVADKQNLTICVLNISSHPELEDRVCDQLRRNGYKVVTATSPLANYMPLGNKHKTRIIAQEANIAAAEMVRNDLGNHGEIVNASVGDIYSNITVMIDDDLQPFLSDSDRSAID